MLPQDISDPIIMILKKNKGQMSDCSNYQGITLLSIAGKALAEVPLNRRIPTIAEENQPRASVVSEPSEARQTWHSSSASSKIKAKNKTRDSIQDRTMAYHETTCLLIKVSTLVIQLHENQHDQIKLNGCQSEPFLITNARSNFEF